MSDVKCDDAFAATSHGSCDVAVLSKRKAKKAHKVTQKIKVGGSVDIMVQHTNDDSVVSKRSAVASLYIEDSYLRHFVRKPSRRSPLINRGYYLRMSVITDVVTRGVRYFLDQSCSGTVQVISLGAGFDTMAFRALLATGANGDRMARASFFDVDFPNVMHAKAAWMKAAPSGTFPPDWKIMPECEVLPVSSPRYHAVGVDLREAEQLLLPRLTTSCTEFSADKPTVIYAECMMQYMPPESAMALMRFIASTFTNALFVAYDQLQPSDSFGKVMQQSLKQKNSPLLGIQAAPDGYAMVSRALHGGMRHARFANFYDLSRHYLQKEERLRVEALEPFDEAEEWAEMCEHYGITMAVSSDSAKESLVDHPAFKDISALVHPHAAAAEGISVSVHAWPSGRFAFDGWGNGQSFSEVDIQRNDTVIISYGGFSTCKGHQRINTVYAHALRDGELPVTVTSSEGEPPSLVYHSCSRLAPFQYVVFGGRTNPQAPSEVVYLLSTTPAINGMAASWHRLLCVSSSRPEARYRHAAAICGGNRLFIFGGRGAAGSILADAWVGTISLSVKTIAWEPLPLSGSVVWDIPPALYSAAALTLDDTCVLVSGGMNGEDNCSDVFYKVNVTTGTSAATRLPAVGGRFSHSMTRVTVDREQYILILGGSTSDMKGKIPQAALVSTQLDSVTPLTLPPACPSWSKHSCVELANGVVAVVGGGYTCFSFGTFTAKPLLLNLGDTLGSVPGMSSTPPVPELITDARNSGRLLSHPRPVLELSYSLETFLSVAHSASSPVVFRDVHLGDCVTKWRDAEYLKAAEGSTVVSVHMAEGSEELDFVRKNFTFRHVPFGDLVDHIETSTHDCKVNKKHPVETWYYRSVASHMKSDRANIWNDFQSLGKDFVLPSGASEYIMPRLHQSCLRMNASPLQLWTHYDTMDNVLCQIVGEKRVILFPPSEFGNLYMCGSSSPVLHVDSPDIAQYPRFVDACKQAQQVILRPGDMLFIPANWFHHITTCIDKDKEGDPYSVSANVFFRHFALEDYDEKDLYANKDVPAVVNLRESIVKQARQLVQDSHLTGTGEKLPLGYAELAVRQAIQDLERYAESLSAAARAACETGDL